MYRAHHRRALHEARKIVANPSDAEDCTAAAFASTFQAIRKGGGPTEVFRPYLLAAVRNAALQLVRLKRYGSEVATEVIEPEAHVDLYEIGADPAVRNAFASLPSRWREVLWKTEIEGVAPRDLATELAMSANGVAALAKRARDGFRKAYLTEAVGPEPHPWAMERLSLYREGALDPRTRDLVELHIESCDRCQDALAPVPVTAASVGAILLVAGAVVPATAAGAAGTAGLLGGLRHLRPRLTTMPGKLAVASVTVAAVIGAVLVVAAAQDDDTPSATPTTVSLVAAAPASTGPTTTRPPTTVLVTAPSSSTTAVPPPQPVTAATPTSVEEGPTTVAELPSTTRRPTTTTRPRSTTRPTTRPTTSPTTPATTTPPVTEPATTVPPTVATTTEPATTTDPATTTTLPATTTTTTPPEYGGTLQLQINRPSYVAVVTATATDGLPAGTRITLQFTSAGDWHVDLGPATRCSGLPSTTGGPAGTTDAVTCTMPALAQGETATVPFTTSGSQLVTVVVTGQRPGGPLATQCDPGSAC